MPMLIQECLSNFGLFWPKKCAKTHFSIKSLRMPIEKKISDHIDLTYILSFLAFEMSVPSV